MLSCADRYNFYITVYSGEIRGSVFAVLYSSRYPSFGFPLAREVIACSAIFIGDFYIFSSILQTITEYRSVYMPLVLLPSVHLLGRYLLQPALCQFCFPKLPMYKMIVAYMIVYFIYILLSNSYQGTIVKKPASPTIRGRGHSYTLHPYYSFIFASFFAWSAAIQASIIS